MLIVIDESDKIRATPFEHRSTNECEWTHAKCDSILVL